MNMEDIMHMNEVLKPYQERSKGDESNGSLLAKKQDIEVINILTFLIYYRLI
jgi:hypothetical protein